MKGNELSIRRLKQNLGRKGFDLAMRKAAQKKRVDLTPLPYFKNLDGIEQGDLPLPESWERVIWDVLDRDTHKKERMNIVAEDQVEDNKKVVDVICAYYAHKLGLSEESMRKSLSDFLAGKSPIASIAQELRDETGLNDQELSQLLMSK